ncbi:MAG: hypothetical protein KAU90_06760 [Sulfurovaceae bacterium]|nr:hypothetical protein [Sulfurovaceae bacterium]
MKQTIIVLIIPSSILFSTTVDNLTIQETNNIGNSSTITKAIVKQATIDIDKNNNTNSDIDDITSTQNNIITSSSINDASVEQGTIDINSSKVDVVELDSLNTIRDSRIESSSIFQGYLAIDDSNISDSDTNDIDIKSTNTISSTKIDSYSSIAQSYTELVSSDVSKLDLEQTNRVEDSLASTSFIFQSKLYVEDSGLTNFNSIQKNTIESTDGTGDNNISSLSTIQQGSILIESSQDVINLTQNVSNEIKDVKILNFTKLSQASIDIKNSNVNTLTTKQKNYIDETNTNEASITQGDININ